MNVTNNHSGPLGLPTGQELQPNVATPVHDWATIKQNAVVAAWLKAGILVEGEAQSNADDAPDRDELIAKLAELGIKHHPNTGIVKLQALLAEAEANKPPLAILHGSDTLAAHIEITDGKTVQLGTIVAAAHAASGLSEEAWNALPADERDALLNAEIDRLKAAEQASED